MICLVCSSEGIYEKFEYTMSRKSKNGQYNGQKKKGKRTHSELQSTTQKTNDCATRIPQRKKTQWKATVLCVIFSNEVFLKFTQLIKIKCHFFGLTDITYRNTGTCGFDILLVIPTNSQIRIWIVMYGYLVSNWYATCAEHFHLEI